MTRAASVLLAALALAAGGAGAAAKLPTPAHMVVIVFENKDAVQIDASSAPTFTALGRRYARLTEYFAVTHPSLPNYLALISGSTHGITTDCTTCAVSGRTIGDELTRAGRSWRAYAEGYPSGARFAKKHVPFLYFRRDTKGVRPLSAFDPQHLPDFAFVTPDVCHDMHDCSIAAGDAWLRAFVRPLLHVPKSVVFIVFDEAARGAATNHVAALAVGTLVRPHSVFTSRTGHYGLLRTIEDLFGLPPLGSARSARPITGIWR